jgi:hypothetical protein
MDSVTKATQPTRSTDRLLEALSTLAALLDRTINEVKSLETSFQERLLQAVRDTETSMENSLASHLEKALTETEEKVRKELTSELKTQFENEVKSLHTSFQERLLQAVHDTETSLQRQAAAHLEKALKATEEKVRKEVTNELKTQFDADLKAALVSVHSQMEAEFKKKAADRTAQWEQERQALIKQVEAAAAKTKTMAHSSTDGPSAVLVKEMENIEKLVANITALIDDPATELSTVIRKNVERAELESYLKGIRFAVGK